MFFFLLHVTAEQFVFSPPSLVFVKSSFSAAPKHSVSLSFIEIERKILKYKKVRWLWQMNSEKYQDLLKMDQVNDMQPTYSNNTQPMPSFPTTTVQIGGAMANQPTFFRPVGPKSMEMTCPSCRCRIKTNVRHRSTAKTHIACLLLTGLCCCCLPYCMDSCRNANHFCPMCETFLGTYSS